MRGIIERLGLSVNEDKTKIVMMPEGKFEFLGYEFRTLYSWKHQKKYIGTRPAQKSITKIRKNIHEKTAANMGCLDASTVVQRLNLALRGWANYFKVGAASKAFKLVSRHCVGRFRHWLGRKHKWKTKGYKKWPDSRLFKDYELLDIRTMIPTYSSVKA